LRNPHVHYFLLGEALYGLRIEVADNLIIHARALHLITGAFNSGIWYYHMNQPGSITMVEQRWVKAPN